MAETFIPASQVLRRLKCWAPASGIDQVLPSVTAELWGWYKEDLNCSCWEGLLTQCLGAPNVPSLLIVMMRRMWKAFSSGAQGSARQLKCSTTHGSNEDTINIGGSPSSGLHPVGQALSVKPGQKEINTAFFFCKKFSCLSICLTLCFLPPPPTPEDHGEHAVQL